jgi:hypothetical protein
MGYGGSQFLSVLHRHLLRLCAGAVLFAASAGSAAAQDCGGSETSTGCSIASIRARLGQFDVDAAVYDLGKRGFKTLLTAVAQDPEDRHSAHSGGPNFDPRSLPSSTVVRPIVCRRDDYAFLPPTATAGLPCDASTEATTDPREIARSMFDHMDMPSLRLGMNPQLGMVAVPTWFWVEGYDGDVIPLTDNLVLTHQECHRVADRDGNGVAQLDPDGAPRTRNECRTLSDTMTVELRVWPRSFAWSFGDTGSKTVACPDAAACPAGVGQPYTDPRSPSPIAHTYRWSSLGANGAADAYTIGLQIAFGAQYRFSTNGGSPNGWQGVGDRALSWTASHRVQEAQAVLTRP